jgi:hypothetical protein
MFRAGREGQQMLDNQATKEDVKMAVLYVRQTSTWFLLNPLMN